MTENRTGVVESNESTTPKSISKKKYLPFRTWVIPLPIEINVGSQGRGLIGCGE
jgi:hypothetical protein